MNNNCSKCSTEIAVTVINENNINKEMINKLFCTAEDTCLTNVEFMEVFNEALFVSLEKKPEFFVEQFSLNSKQEFILKQLERPISDKINLDTVIEKLTKTSMKKQESYHKILQALRLAKSKV
jgi:hypothetical protein